MIPVPIEGWIAGMLKQAGGCKPTCSIVGIVSDQHVQVIHNGQAITFRMPKQPSVDVWDRFIIAWQSRSSTGHGRSVTVDLTEGAA